ncbi:MAG: hypothetical protein Q4G43_09580 [Mobilicoccus sp.]|nr:hypothetical protein [Mobilicoccus sp.]
MTQQEHPDAVAEFDAAVRWYEQRQPGVGLNLIDQAERARYEIDEWPHAAPIVRTADDGSALRSKAIRGYTPTASSTPLRQR